jgi:DNA-binding transcriptional MerR regulator
MEKSREAFRTISEVSELLDTPAHVLRFWESRFPQVRPVKRAGGRRYYRPTDVALLFGIKQLLHSDGLTIRGVQKVLREHGIRHVMALADGAVNLGAGADAPAEAEVVAELPNADVLVLGVRAETAPLETASKHEETLPLWTQPVEPAPEQPAPAALAEAAPEVWLPTLLRRLASREAEADRTRLEAIAHRLGRLQARYRGDEGGMAG